MSRLSLRDLDEAFDHARADLQALDGASLLVTGGTGFVGRALLALLAHAWERLRLDLAVTVLTRDPNRFGASHPDLAALPFLRLVAGDVRDAVAVPGRLTHVVHAATETNLAPEHDPMGLVRTVTEGTRHVLALAEAAGARRLLYLSSGAVYGPQAPDLPRIPESYAVAPDPLDPRTVYGGAKRLAELMCAIATAEGRVEAVVARGFAFVGPGLPLDGFFAIGNFIRDAMAGRPIVVAGDGTPLRSYLYAGDLAAWLVTLLARGEKGHAYNVGSDQAIRIADLAGLVASVLPGVGPVTVLGRPDPAAARRRYVPDIARARALGLEPWTPLEEAVRRTVAAHGRAA